MNIVVLGTLARAESDPYAGAACRYDAGEITGLADSDSVATWADLAGSYDLTQATAGYKPLYKTNIIGGRPVVRFDGSDDYLANTSFGVSFSGGDMTIFLVMSQVFQALYDGILCMGDAGADDFQSADGISTEQGVGLFMVARRQGSNNCEFSGAVAAGRFGVVTLRRNGGTAILRLNGTQIGTDTYDDVNTMSPDRIVMSARGLVAGVSNAGQNDFAEVVIYNSALSDVAIATLEEYLLNKYTDDVNRTATSCVQWQQGTESGYEANYFDLGKYNTTSYASVARFPNIYIPQGTTITSATLYAKASNNWAGTVCNAILYGNDADNPTLPANAAACEALEKTSASTTLDAVPTWTNATEYEVGDVTDIVQEILNREGWTFGNAMMIISNDNGSDNSAFRQSTLAGGIRLVITV